LMSCVTTIVNEKALCINPIFSLAKKKKAR